MSPSQQYCKYAGRRARRARQIGLNTQLDIRCLSLKLSVWVWLLAVGAGHARDERTTICRPMSRARPAPTASLHLT